MANIVVISRHGKKFDPRPKEEQERNPRVGGNWVDKKFYTITEESKVDLRQRGVQILGLEEYAHSVSIVSDFRRTNDSAEAFLGELADKTKFDKRMDIGFGTPGINWTLACLSYSDEKALCDKYIVDLFTQFYFPTKGDPTKPVMAQYGHGVVVALSRGIETLMGLNHGREGDSVLTLFSHCPNIDAVTTVFGEGLDVDVGNRVVTLNDNYQGGSISMGEMFIGHLEGLRTDNPSLALVIRGREVGYKLTDLHRKVQELYEHAKLR